MGIVCLPKTLGCDLSSRAAVPPRVPETQPEQVGPHAALAGPARRVPLEHHPAGATGVVLQPNWQEGKGHAAPWLVPRFGGVGLPWLMHFKHSIGTYARTAALLSVGSVSLVSEDYRP